MQHTGVQALIWSNILCHKNNWYVHVVKSDYEAITQNTLSSPYILELHSVLNTHTYMCKMFKNSLMDSYLFLSLE